MRTTVPSLLVFSFLFMAAPQAAAAPQDATAAPAATGETAEERKARQEEEREARREEAELEHERSLERIEMANEEEDKFGPLGCVCLSIVFPPLMPLWVVLMILVDNEPAPTPKPGVGVEPAVPLERLKEQRNEVASRRQAPAQRF